MKTKITSLLAATLAASTFFSCSNEIEAPDNGQILNPGDVQISIGLGNGATTYSTVALEKLIKDGSGKLFKNDGTSITMNNATIATVSGVNKFTATVSAGAFTEGEAAKLYLYVNGTPSSAVATGTDEAKFAASTVNTVIGRDLANGLPAGFGPTAVTLKGGNVATATVALKRAAARVGAVSTTGASIIGYTVALNNVNTTSGAIFTEPIAASATGRVERVLDGVTTDMFGTTETVGYVYPSVSSTVTVTPTTGTSLTVPFDPKAGKNYTVKITPSNADANIDWNVTIDEWDSTDGDINADLNTKFAAINIIGTAVGKFGALPADKHGVSVNAGQTLDNFDFSDVVEAPAGFSQIQKIELVSSYAGASNALEITPIAATFVKIVTASNYVGPEVSQILKLTFIKDDGVTTTTEFTTLYLLESVDYIAKVSIPFNGVTWMPFNTSGNLETDQATAKAISETAGNTVADKVVAYAYTNEANFRKVQGHFFLASQAAAKCPAGYKIASLADYKSLAGVDVPKRGTGAPSTPVDKWLKVGVDTEDFTISTLSREVKTSVITGGLGFYSLFTEKKGGAKLPFIGTSSHGTVNTNLGGGVTGYAMFTGEKRGQNYERVSPFFDGWANNEGSGDENLFPSSVRCVKN